MQIIIFLIEVSLIFLLIDMDSFEYKSADKKNNQYSAYYSINEVGDNSLFLSNVSNEKKFIIWKNSTIKEEILENFPNINIIVKNIESRIIDDDDFKQRLINNIEYIQGKYLSGEITEEEFKNALYNPDPSLPSF
jgi:hypothetical protein